ncbi:MAG: WhiB family transcriptional regulator [Candidatus Nanopelagicaceae bacterium]
MSVLFGELLIPGWNEELIGLESVTGEVSLPCHDLVGAEADLFFNEDDKAVAKAKALCAACPMKAACLAGALSRQEPCGVWGGELFSEGEVIERKRKAGRPRLLDSVAAVEDNAEVAA